MKDIGVPIEQWPLRMQSWLQANCEHIRHVVVLRETDSTQDAARRLRAQPGTAILAWRQTAGRGRLGRPWADTAELGVALTIVSTRGKPEELAIKGALATALAAEHFLQRRVGIKWPNDIVVNDLKLAGVLIEQFDSTALIGIGMNVRQKDWPADLKSRAVSLAQLGVDVDRIEVIASILKNADMAMRMNSSDLRREFSARDILRNKVSTFRAGKEIITGAVLEIDPTRGVCISHNGGERWLEAATTTVLQQHTTLPSMSAAD
jgi:BirA family biotin operon repressor/biotin-[acetyl-CoA-carboxylase] ligase